MLTRNSITAELDALTVEIFATTFGADWQQAADAAAAELPESLAYAADYDAWVCSLAQPAKILTLDEVRALGLAIFDAA